MSKLLSFFKLGRCKGCGGIIKLPKLHCDACAITDVLDAMAQDLEAVFQASVRAFNSAKIEIEQQGTDHDTP